MSLHGKALGFIFLLAIGLNACESSVPASPDPTARIVYVTATPAESSTPAPAPTLAPGFTPAPTVSGPHFSREILFATQPDPALASRTFARKTPQVYALWRYSGMTNGLRVRREWLQNGQPYLERENDWDFKKYGANGLMTDTAIFDFAEGLPNGHYELRLYIDRQPQFSEADAPFRSFDLGIATSSPGLSPDSRYLAFEAGPGVLIVMDGAGRRREIARADAIAGLGWLPDSLHLAYSIFHDNPDPRQRQFDLWLVDIETGDTRQLNRAGESLSQPLVSPDGKRIAALEGNGAGGLCSDALGLAIIELDRATLARAKIILLDDFAGLSAPNGAAKAFVADTPPRPGAWQSPTVIETRLSWTCAENPPDQTYALDTLALTASPLVGDAP